MKRILGLVLGAAILVTGCADPVPPTTPTPAVPTVTETFSDTLLVNGANVHNFTVTTVGGLKVTLPSVAPSAAVGIGISTQGVSGCTVPLLETVTAVAGSAVVLSGTVTVPGTYCVEIYDVNNLVEPVAYTINVLHS